MKIQEISILIRIIWRYSYHQSKSKAQLRNNNNLTVQKEALQNHKTP